ncbi:MAG TPA: hypothetical protein VL393_11770 [Candidatus Binataceae bacterium]|jgi:hypothetical protein|nr:hypothetical protein [Candidatus Binataceae bacterium]
MKKRTAELLAPFIAAEVFPKVEDGGRLELWHRAGPSTPVPKAVADFAAEHHAELLEALTPIREAALRLVRAAEESGTSLWTLIRQEGDPNTPYKLPPEDHAFRIELWRRAKSNEAISKALFSADPPRELLRICNEQGLFIRVDGDYLEIDGRVSHALLRAISQHSRAIGHLILAGQGYAS